MKNIISILRAFSGDLGHFVSKWTATSFLTLSLACGLLCGSCGVIKPYVPIETNTEVHIKDSTIYHFLDSVRITEATRYKDLAWLGDTLKIKGQRSRAWAYADTTREVLIGGLEEDKIEEHTKVVYKDRIEYRDSIRNVEVPVPVEVVKETKVYPKWLVILSILGVISTSILGISIYLKVKRK